MLPHWQLYALPFVYMVPLKVLAAFFFFENEETRSSGEITAMIHTDPFFIISLSLSTHFVTVASKTSF